MLCSVCQAIFEAKSESIYISGRSRFRHHDTITTLKESAISGCRLCSTIWFQIPHEIRNNINDSTRLDSETQVLGPVTFTIDEMLRRDGRYTLNFFSHKDQAVSDRINLIKIDDSLINDEKRIRPAAGTFHHSNLCIDYALAIVQKWLTTCLQSHTHCRQETSAARERAFRLLEIRSNEIGYSVRLCSSSEIPSQARYLTLSHCWGGFKIRCLTRDRLQSFRENLDIHELPQTFQDAISLSRRLGFQYLWIDSLCIVQDDPEDWKEQAALMADVYQGSWCNIAATGAVDGTHGLFQFLKRIDAPLEPFYVHIKGSEAAQIADFEHDDEEPWLFEPHPREDKPWSGFMPGNYEVLDRELWYRNVSDSPLGRRAWIVQERLLAPRVLHFAKDQMFWECNELKACELYPLGLPERADLLSSAELKSAEVTSGYSYPPNYVTAADWNEVGQSPRILQAWNDIVEVYSKANLTFDSDKLIAIHGLAKAFQNRIKAPYIAGMWAVHLHRQLLWSIRVPSECPKERSAPTWCWASVNGEVRGVVDIDDKIERRLATILNFNMKGEIFKRSGTVKIQGRLIPCTLSFEPDVPLRDQCNPTVRGLESAAFVSADVSLDKDTTPALFSIHSFFCVPTVIFRDATEPTTPEVAGLVLRSTDRKGVYERFGVFRTDNAGDRDGDVHPDWLHDTKVQPRRRTRFGRVFLMDVEDEQAEVEERLYERYERAVDTDGFGNFVFSID